MGHPHPLFTHTAAGVCNVDYMPANYAARRAYRICNNSSITFFPCVIARIVHLSKIVNASHRQSK